MQAWENFLLEQQQELGIETTTRWLRSLKVVHFDACNLYLEASDHFQIHWFEEHVRSKALTNLVNNNHRQIKVHLTLAQEEAVPKRTKKKKSEVKDEKQSFNFSQDLLDPFATFDHFICGEANKVPFQLLQELVQSPKDPAFNPVYLYGEQGVGKSHLLMATAHHLKQKGLQVIYVHAETFTEHVVSAIRIGNMQGFRRTYRTAEVLIIDDVHLFSRRSATQEELFHTFNALHTSRRQILLSANCTPQFLQEIEPRLMSRFEWGITLPLKKLNPSDLSTLLHQRCKWLGLSLEPEVAHFLLENFSHTKSLIKALDALVLRRHLAGHSTVLDKTQVQTLLSDLINEEKKNTLSPERIIHVVAKFYGIRTEDILGKAQNQECAQPRQMAMFLCRAKLHLPYIKLGKIFNRDHSTVMTSIKQIQKKIEAQDKETQSILSEISRHLTTSSEGTPKEL